MARLVAVARAADAAPAASNAVDACVAALPSPEMSEVERVTTPMRPATDVTPPDAGVAGTHADPFQVAT